MYSNTFLEIDCAEVLNCRCGYSFLIVWDKGFLNFCDFWVSVWRGVVDYPGSRKFRKRNTARKNLTIRNLRIRDFVRTSTGSRSIDSSESWEISC